MDNDTRTKEFNLAEYHWSEARRRMNAAKGPSAAQSAARSMEKYAEELRSLGAVATKRGWKLPKEATA